MSDPHLSTHGQSIDLSKLNEAERLILGLLAEGHTAKSIASTTGSTEAAVNERLREARRKTGVSSSRELARFFKAQENRDELIGVGDRRPPEAMLPTPGAPPRFAQRGVFAMIAAIVAVAGAAALITQIASHTTTATDPLIAAPLVDGPNAAALHDRVRAEPRDEAWAARLEPAIRARVSRIPLVGKNGNVLRVTCGRTLCEIAGTLISPTDQAELENPNSSFNRSIRDLQVAPLPDDLAKLGLRSETGLFTSGKGRPDRAAYLLYYSRKD